jgi:hypothetical protein
MPNKRSLTKRKLRKSSNKKKSLKGGSPRNRNPRARPGGPGGRRPGGPGGRRPGGPGGRRPGGPGGRGPGGPGGRNPGGPGGQHGLPPGNFGNILHQLNPGGRNPSGRNANQQFRNPPTNFNANQGYMPQNYVSTSREGRDYERFQQRLETLSRGTTIEKRLKEISKELHKTWCRIKSGCNKYPNGRTLALLEDFKANLKIARKLIKEINRSSAACKDIARDSNERREKKKLGCSKI